MPSRSSFMPVTRNRMSNNNTVDKRKKRRRKKRGEGIQSLGTVNKGRLSKDLKIPSLKDLKSTKTERKHSEEWVAEVDGMEVGIVMFYDNKPVVLSSSFLGQQPIERVSRYCKKKKYIYIKVDCPKIVQIYNQHVEGADLLDSLLGKYLQINMRTKNGICVCLTIF